MAEAVLHYVVGHDPFNVDIVCVGINHQLVGVVCNPAEVWQLTDEMLITQAEWLSQYAQAIPTPVPN